MVEKKEQIIRFSDDELAVLKSTFAERTDILFLLRKHFLQMGMTEQEYIQLKTAVNKDVTPVLRKMYLPEIIGDLPIGQEIDLWATLKIEEMTPAQAFPHILARQTVIDYFEQELNRLEDKGEQSIMFASLMPAEDADTTYINMLVRSTICKHTEQQLQQIKALAGFKSETPEETLARLKKDSNK